MNNKTNTQPQMRSLTAGEHKSLRRWVRIFFALFVITGLLGIEHNLFVRYHPEAIMPHERVSHVRIGGRDFAVPNKYLRAPVPRNGEIKQLYILVTLPNYEPYNYNPYKGDGVQEQGRAPVGHRVLYALIDDTAFRTDLPFRYNAYRNGPNNIFSPKDVDDVFGLHRTLVYDSTPRSPEPFVRTDLYSSESVADNPSVNRFIACRPDESPPQNPMCEHFFQDGRLIYKLSYSKVNLAKWQAIEDRMHNLVESFSCVPANSDPPATSSNGAPRCPP